MHVKHAHYACISCTHAYYACMQAYYACMHACMHVTLAYDPRMWARRARILRGGALRNGLWPLMHAHSLVRTRIPTHACTLRMHEYQGTLF